MLESHIIITTLPMAGREALAMRRPDIDDRKNDDTIDGKGTLPLVVEALYDVG